MSKKNYKYRSNIHKYPHYKVDYNIAKSLNDMSYDSWLLSDEGKLRPDSMRLSIFLAKYGTRQHNILHYISKEKRNLIYQWVDMTKAERKEVLRHDNKIGNKINKWLHEAELEWFIANRK